MQVADHPPLVHRGVLDCRRLPQFVVQDNSGRSERRRRPQFQHSTYKLSAELAPIATFASAVRTTERRERRTSRNSSRRRSSDSTVRTIRAPATPSRRTSSGASRKAWRLARPRRSTPRRGPERLLRRQSGPQSRKGNDQDRRHRSPAAFHSAPGAPGLASILGKRPLNSLNCPAYPRPRDSSRSL